MKKFRFRLERVLQHREMIKREKQRDFLREQQVLYEQQERLETLLIELMQTGLSEGDVALVQNVQLLGAYTDRLRLSIEQTRLNIERSIEKVEIARKIYQEAVSDAEALEKLRSKKSHEYDVMIAKEDEKFLDELAVMRAGMSEKEGE